MITITTRIVAPLAGAATIYGVFLYYLAQVQIDGLIFWGNALSVMPR